MDEIRQPSQTRRSGATTRPRTTADEHKETLRDFMFRHRRNRSFLEAAKEFDMFGVPINQFTLNGKTKIKTTPGLVFTSFIMVAMLYFGLSKMPYLIAKKNPSVTNYLSIEHFDSTNEVDLSTNRFGIAFGLEDYKTREVKDDPFFVEWHAGHHTYLNGEESVTPLPLHKCNDEDWKDFNEPSKSSKP